MFKGKVLTESLPSTFTQKEESKNYMEGRVNFYSISDLRVACQQRPRATGRKPEG